MNTNSKWVLAGLVMAGVVGGIALVSAGTATVHWAGSTKFCSTFCHSMDTVYAAYKRGTHGQLASGFQVSCSDCHLKYESEKEISQAQVVGLLFHKATSGMVSLWGEIRGTMNTPEQQKAMSAELGERVSTWMQSTGFSNCRGCHDLSKMGTNPAKPFVPALHQPFVEDKTANCLMCHPTAGHKYE